jgi:CelD/BcsL family acetyltransferase involved in cellulose biosynthesis
MSVIHRIRLEPDGVTAELVHGIDSVEAEWEDLADRMGESPFLRPGWFNAWQRAFVKRKIEVLTVRQDGGLVGVLPLARMPYRVRSATNPHTPIFGLLARDAQARDALAQAFFASAPRSALIGYLDASRPDGARLRRAAHEAGYRVLERSRMRSPYAVTTGTWEDYVRSRSRNVRSDLRRRTRRISEEGEFVLDINVGERLPDALEEGYRIEGSGWKDARGTAIRSREDTRCFYTEIAQWAAGRGWLRLCFLRWQGRPIAFHFDLLAGNVLYHLKGGFDTRFASSSPSKVLHYLMLRYACEAGLTRYEFLGLDEPYKLQLADAAHERHFLHFCAPSVTGQAERLGYMFATRHATRLRELRRARRTRV